MTTPRLGIEELEHGELNGDVTYNDGLRLIEMLVQTVITELNATSPPGSPGHGDMYTVGNATNWGGGSVLYDLAQYYNGDWYYYTPFEGMRLYDLDTSTDYQYTGSAWA